jgi:hypothetical protein
VWLAEGALLSAIVDEVDMGFSSAASSVEKWLVKLLDMSSSS